MATRTEAINPQLVLRIIAGLLAIGGLIALPVNFLEDLVTNKDFRAMDILKIVGVSCGIFVFGYFSLKGKLPSSLAREA